MSDFEAARQAVFNLITEYEDIDALLRESSGNIACSSLVSDALNQEASCKPSVEGILSALETRCVVTGSPAPVVSAVTLGGKLRSLLSADSVAQTHSVLTDESRDRLLTITEVCRRLQLGPGFSQKAFVKTLCKDCSEMLNLEGLWRLQEAGLLTMELYVKKNLSRPTLVKNIAKGIVDLCTSQESGDESVELRKQIVSSLIVSLLHIENNADADNAADNVSKGLRKVSSALLDSITKKIVQVPSKCDLSPFDCLHLVDVATRKRYCSRQLNVLLSSNAVLKVSDALLDQSKWTYLHIDSHLRTVYEQLLEPFDAAEVADHICRALKHHEVNWKCLLSLTAVTLVTCHEAKQHVHSMIEDFLRHAMTDCNQESLVACMLLVRQACLEGPHVFKSYEDWFQTSFGNSKTSLCTSKKSFAFLVQFLSDIVPYETGHCLKVHVTRTPFVPAKCRPLWSDYVTLARTRLMDLKESLDDQATSHDAVPREKLVQQTQLVESDIEKALSSFEKNFKVPSSVLEASIFRKPYYVGRFLPTLLQPRPLPDVADLKMKFIDSLVKSGKIPESLYTVYEQQCKKRTAEILEGVSFEDDADMEVELSMTVEEQLKYSLDSLHDAVIKQHSVTAAADSSYVRHFTSISEKLSAVTKMDSMERTPLSTELLVIDVNNLSSENCNIMVAQMLLNCIGETVTKLFNLAVKQCDSSWLTQLLLMLRSHVALLRTLCAVVCHLVTRQADTLSDCHAHALAAVLVHWNNYDRCSAGIRVQPSTTDGTKAEVVETVPFALYVLESLPLSTTTGMSFSLLFAVSYITYAEMISRDRFTDKNRTSPDVVVTQQSAEECIMIPDHIGQLLSYLGPRLVKDLRSHSSNLGIKESVISNQFMSVERFLSSDSVRRSLEQNRMSFETWAQKEIEIVDDDDLSREWLCEYYNWVAFTRWHKLQSVADSSSRVYFVSMLQALAHAVLDFDTRCSQQHSCCHTTQQRNRRRQNGRENIFNLLQKLSQISCYDQAGDDVIPWLWSVLEQCTASRYHPSETDVSAVSTEARVAAFFRLMIQLPSTAIVTCQRSPTTQVHGLVQLQNAVTEFGRNMIDVCVLPPDLTLHLVLTLASLPLGVNRELQRFLSECPLITLSAVLHTSTTGSAVNLASCANAMTDMLGKISSALDEATTLLHGAARPSSSTLPAWLSGAALWSRLYNSRYTIDASHLRSDIETAESLLHCLTLDMATGMLHGDDSWKMVEDAAIAVWSHHIDALHCLSDNNEQSQAAGVFQRCMPDVLQRMQPLSCLRLFTCAANGDLGQFTSQWNITRTLHWYTRCVQLFDCGQCAIMTVLTVLQQASTAICSFTAKMPLSQLRDIDQTTLDAVDPHIRLVIQQLRNV